MDGYRDRPLMSKQVALMVEYYVLSFVSVVLEVGHKGGEEEKRRD